VNCKSVKVDDVVMYYPQAGLPVSINGESLLVLREEEIYAVVD
jgi:co-chaperonin GroES (HSP10)